MASRVCDLAALWTFRTRKKTTPRKSSKTRLISPAREKVKTRTMIDQPSRSHSTVSLRQRQRKALYPDKTDASSQGMSKKLICSANQLGS